MLSFLAYRSSRRTAADLAAARFTSSAVQRPDGARQGDDKRPQRHHYTPQCDAIRYRQTSNVLVVVAFVAGIIAGISPCILPVLPIVLFAGANGSLHDDHTPEPMATSWWRASGLRRSCEIVAGLVTSFTLLVLVGAEVLSLFGLPSGLLRWVGIVLLALLGLALVVPQLGEVLERPFSRLAGRQAKTSNGFIIGFALGLVFVPCAGPVLATITVLGATNHVTFSVVLVALAFGIGVSVPLLFVALAGDRLVARSGALRSRGPALRRLGGVVVLVFALGIATNAFAGLQRAVPGYTAALQSEIEGGAGVRTQLDYLKGGSHGLASCPSDAVVLVQCGTAPAFTDISAWLNTPSDKPLTLRALRGHVVLVDFWTYTCINCQRSLPHVEAWASRYQQDGLDVIGVHTPEFSFEHQVSNVASAAKSLGVHYPIAVDNSYGTWNAYDNEYWPAEYLIDSHGDVRHVSFGEGGYGITETQIRQLLRAAHPGVSLPAPTSVPNTEPMVATNPETYLGSERLAYIVSSQLPSLTPEHYVLPASVPFPLVGFGGTWSFSSEGAFAGPDATLKIAVQASNVYLVMGGSGTVQVRGPHGSSTVHVHGIPTLYTILHGAEPVTGTIRLAFSPGIRAYDFTFG